jgi:hypothetical protein
MRSAMVVALKITAVIYAGLIAGFLTEAQCLSR